MSKAKQNTRGKKICPQCSTQNSARQRVCTNEKCGYVFEIKTAGKVKNNSGVDIEKESLRFALSNGGIDKSVKILEGWKENNIAEFIMKCGGKDNAIAELKKLEIKF